LIERQFFSHIINNLLKNSERRSRSAATRAVFIVVLFAYQSTAHARLLRHCLQTWSS